MTTDPTTDTVPAGETPIRDKWHCPPGHDSPRRQNFNAFLDDVIAPLERELADCRAELERVQAQYRELLHDVDENARASAVEAGWKERQGGDYGSY